MMPWKRGAILEVYKDRAGEWRWRAKSRNGRIIADSAEGYSRRAGAVNGAHRNYPDLRIVEPITP